MLNNVSKWDPEIGLKHITAQEAYKENPNGSSSHNNEYICETCGQSVTFYIHKGTPAFRHSNKSNDCEDKIQGYTYIFNKNTNPLGFSLPLRIVLLENTIDIQIGFLPLSFEKINKLKSEEDFVFQINDESQQPIKTYTSERLSDKHITYLSIGNNLSRYYILDYNTDIIKTHIWPKIIDGILPTGTLFDAYSGKRLPKNAEVIVGREYWLLTQERYLHNKEISISLRQSYFEWYIYSIKANFFSKSVAAWFFKYDVRLSNMPAKVTPIWPIVNRSAHCLTYFSDELYFYKTSGLVDVYPNAKRCQKSAGVFCIKNQPIEQIISVSRFVSDERKNVIKYTLAHYMKSTSFDIKTYRKFSIKDKNNEPIKLGENEELPENGQIFVESDVDGFIRIEENNFPSRQIKIKSANRVSLNVTWGQVIKIYQGLDCVAELSFVKANVKNLDDESFVQTLIHCGGEIVPLRHSAGALFNKLTDMPQTRRWLQQQLKKQVISVQALKILQKRFGKM